MQDRIESECRRTVGRPRIMPSCVRVCVTIDERDWAFLRSLSGTGNVSEGLRELVEAARTPREGV